MPNTRQGNRPGSAILALSLFLMLSLGPPCAAQSSSQPGDDPGGLSDIQAMGYGCLIGTATMMAITAAVGPVEVVQIFAGGMLTPSSSQVLWTSLTMGAGAQTCTAAGLATPALLHAWDSIRTYWRGSADGGG